MEYAVRTKGLGKTYGKFEALSDFSMNIPKGSIYGFVGKNGAGKTTLIRLLTGLQKPTAGEFEIFGIRNDDKAIRKSRMRMGAVVENPAIYMGMTAADNLKQQYITMGLPGYDGLEDLLKLVGLDHTGRKKARNFSLGMKQRLGIAIALCGEPDFLILDEPVNGLDPQGIIEIRELILKLNREKGITILISSHILDELSRLATHYGFIDKGHLIREMSAEELEAASRKSVRMTVDDTKVLAGIMDELGVEYKIIDDQKADIYCDMTFSELAAPFAAKNCQIIKMEENDESLEAFYLALVGGNNECTES